MAEVTLKQRIGQVVFPRLPITRFLFDQLRFEFNGWLVKAKYRALPSWRRQLRLVRSRSGVLLNVACGPQLLEKFVNIDLLPAFPEVLAWDCRRSVPVADGAARGIRVEQFVEHLETREELPAFLRDCRRALAPAGVLRIIVPDGERYLRAYCADDDSGFRALAVPDPLPTDLPTRMDVINHVFHQWHEHRWAYDFETLARRLSDAGFTRIVRSAYRQSLIPELANDREVHAPYSLYVEAIRD